MDTVKELGCMLAVFALAWLLWDSALTWPLRVLVVLFHEAAHAMAVLATGGRVGGIYLYVREGAGVTKEIGGNHIISLNLGYLGSMLIGAMFLCATYGSMAEQVMLIMGAFIIAIAALWVTNVSGFFWSLLIGFGIGILGQLLAGLAEVYVARFIALCCLLCSFFSLRSYTKMIIRRRIHGNPTDAKQLGSITGIPAIGWVIMWNLESLAVLTATFCLVADGVLSR